MNSTAGVDPSPLDVEQVLEEECAVLLEAGQVGGHVEVRVGARADREVVGLGHDVDACGGLGG